MFSRKKLISYLSAGFAFQLIIASSTLATDFLVTVSKPLNKVVNAGDNFLVQFDLNRSYVCTLAGIDNDSELGLSTSVISPLAISVPAEARGNTTPQVSSGSSDNDSNDNRVAIFSTVAGTWTINVDSAKAGGEEANFACEESTLYAGFNTFVNTFNFLELNNISNNDIQVILIAQDFNGVTTSETFIVSANRRRDIDIHTRVGPSVFGIAKIKHNGPIGAIKGAISQYDSDFQLSVSDSLSRRDD